MSHQHDALQQAVSANPLIKEITSAVSSIAKDIQVLEIENLKSYQQTLIDNKDKMSSALHAAPSVQKIISSEFSDLEPRELEALSLIRQMANNADDAIKTDIFEDGLNKHKLASAAQALNSDHPVGSREFLSDLRRQFAPLLRPQLSKELPESAANDTGCWTCAELCSKSLEKVVQIVHAIAEQPKETQAKAMTTLAGCLHAESKALNDQIYSKNAFTEKGFLTVLAEVALRAAKIAIPDTMNELELTEAQKTQNRKVASNAR